MERWLGGSGAPSNAALPRKLSGLVGEGRVPYKNNLPIVCQVIEVVYFGHIALQVFLSGKMVVFNKNCLEIATKMCCF